MTGCRCRRGGNQPITTRQSFKIVQPKSFFPSLHFFFFCTSFVIWPHDPPPSSLLSWIRFPPPPLRPRRGGRLLDWLDWLPSHLITPGATAQPIRDALFVLLVFSHVTDIKKKKQQDKKRNSPNETRNQTESRKSSPGFLFFLFLFSLEGFF